MGSFAAASLGFNLFMWDAGNIVLPYASIALALLLVYGINTSWGYLRNQAQAPVNRSLRPICCRLNWCQEMAGTRAIIDGRAKRRVIGAFLSDVRSFTTISRRLEPQGIDAFDE